MERIKKYYLILANILVRKLIKHVGPSLVIEALTDDKFKYFNPDKLEAKYRNGYKVQARDILNKTVWRNEKARYFAECADFCLREARSWKEIEGMRWSINGIEAFEQQLVALAGDVQEDSE